MGTRARWLIGAIGLVAMLDTAAARPSAPAAPVLVELFTSEGCSSCPPADALLMDLIRTQPVPGAVIIGLSEHVDYWDHQGWKDPFSGARFTSRQSAYAGSLRVPDIYTPQLVIDGSRELVGQDRAGAVAAIAAAARAPKRAVHLSWAAANPPAIEIRIDPAAQSGEVDEVSLAVTEDGLASQVTAGENDGHRLAHAAVVRRLDSVGRTDAHGAFSRTVGVPLAPAWRRSALHVVVFGQAAHTRRVTAAGMVPVGR